MYLESKHIDDWPEFVNENDIDFSCTNPDCKDGSVIAICPVCRGKGKTKGKRTCANCHGEGYTYLECPDCDATGFTEYPIWNTIWDTGFHSRPGTLCVLRHPAPNIVAFVHNGTIWFGLSGCGMDMTPYLALAWINMFPNCNWLPHNFMVTGCNLTGGYVESCVGKDDALRIYASMMETSISDIKNAERLQEDLHVAMTKAKSKKRK